MKIPFKRSLVISDFIVIVICVIFPCKGKPIVIMNIYVTDNTDTLNGNISATDENE